MNEMTKAEIRRRLGNITQLQELLFGEQIEQYNHKLQLFQQRLELLEANDREFRLNIEKYLTQLEKKLSRQIADAVNALEKKLSYLGQTSQAERQQIQGELTIIAQENLDLVQNKIKVSNSNLRGELAHLRTDLEQEHQLFQQKILSKLESSLSELSANKMSRKDLAEVLFELCLKLKQDSPQSLDSISDQGNNSTAETASS